MHSSLRSMPWYIRIFVSGVVYLGLPDIIPQILHLYNQGMPLDRKLHGPVTMSQKDLSWLGCDFDPSTGIVAQRMSACSTCLFEENEDKFENHSRIF